MSFSSSLALTLIYEGGKADNPKDPGGRTNYGITQAVYDPTGKRDVFNIQMNEVTRIYYTNYWIPAKCDRLDDALATAHFDAAVNTGIHQAAILLQRATKSKIDGIIGPLSIQAAYDDPNAVTHELIARRNFYLALIAKRPALKVWQSNWLHRVNSLATHLGVTLPDDMES